MLNDFTGADKIYIACGYTDLRKGIDGLARLVQQQFELDSFTNTLFLFCGRLHPAVQATGTGRIPVAALGIRGKGANAAAVPLAHGRSKN